MHARYLKTFLAIFLALAYEIAAAGQNQGIQSLDALRSAAAQFLQGKAAAEYPWLRASVEVTPPDPRLRLPQCTEFRFFLTPGNQPYGSGSLGAQCAAPQPWALYLAYTVRLKGPALVAVRPIVGREVIKPQDVQVRETEYTQSPLHYLQKPDQANGLLARYPIAAGQPLLHNMLAQPLSVRAGEKVRLYAEGEGFSVSQECTALNNALEGQAVRCRVPSGRILQGTATESGTVVVNH